jgi:PTH1 family peptidyl-tRNA hydrolase
VGLGNPGARYRRTRHNVGFRVVDALAEQLGIHCRKPFFHRYTIGKGRVGREEIVLAKPLTYMNRSGEAVSRLLKRYASSLEDLLVVCDTLDLPVGRCRLKLKGGSGGHRGLESIIQWIGSEQFKRLVIGIGRPASSPDVVGYVLGEPQGGEAELLQRGVHLAAEGVLLLIEHGPQRVMNALNIRI